MFSYQRITIAGRVSRPDFRYTGKGTPVFSFSLPVEEGYKTEEGSWENNTVWFRVTTFGKYAETLNRLVGNGAKVLVVGTLQFDHETGGPRIWQDKDGKPRASFEVKVGMGSGEVTILDNGEVEDFNQDNGSQEEFDDLPGDDDELPF